MKKKTTFAFVVSVTAENGLTGKPATASQVRAFLRELLATGAHLMESGREMDLHKVTIVPVKEA